MNQLLVAHNVPLLKFWDGHGNVKYAGNVNLFEYLHKYVFKGPDVVRYSLIHGLQTSHVAAVAAPLLTRGDVGCPPTS